MNEVYTGLICDFGGKNSGNEDAAIIYSFIQNVADPNPKNRSFQIPGIISILSDGVSSSNHGELAASYVIHQTLKKLINYILDPLFTIRNLQDQITKILHLVNSELRNEFSEELRRGKTPMCTIAGIIVIGQWLFSFILGDSPIFLNKDRSIIEISDQHKGISIDHEITQAFGMETISPSVNVYNWAYETKEPSPVPIFESNYYAILCSDGISDVISPEEIKETLLEKDKCSIQEKCQKIYEKALEKGTKDNCTLIVLSLGEYLKHISLLEQNRIHEDFLIIAKGDM